MDVAVLARHHVGQFAAVGGNAQALADAFEQSGAALFVANVFGQNVRRRGALAQVMAQAGKAHGQGGVESRAHVQHHHQVNAGVDLGVVVRPLRHAPELVDFWQQPLERAAFAQHLEHARRLVRHQPPCQLLPHALGHQMVGLAVGHHLAHQLHRLCRYRKIGKARRKAGHPQDAHRVFPKRIGHMAQHFVAQVLLTVVRVDQAAQIGLEGSFFIILGVKSACSPSL